MEEMQSKISHQDSGPERPNSTRHYYIWQFFSVFVIGASIGWIAGLTVAPVTVTILTSILGLATGVVVGLQTLQRKNDSSEQKDYFIDARPAALLILGIAIAAPLGIMARTYELFAPGIMNVDKVEEAVDTENRGMAATSRQDDPGRAPYLYGKYVDDCERVLAMSNNDKAFLGQLKDSNIPASNDMVERFNDDPETLEYFVRIICSKYQPIK
jgi:hypothetical protein